MKNLAFLFVMTICIFSFAKREKPCAKKTQNKSTTTNTIKSEDMKKPLSSFNTSQTTTLVVNEKKGICDGSGMLNCLQIKKEGKDNFDVFYQGIEGFTFEEGYRQTILVNERYVANPLEKQAEPIYTLVKVISKEKIAASVNPEDIKKPYSGMTVSQTKTIVVHEKKAACEGDADAKCLQIKKEGKNNFEVFYQDIEGFVFEDGYRQTILVNERHVPNPMIKDTAPVYTLKEVLSKEKIK